MAGAEVVREWGDLAGAEQGRDPPSAPFPRAERGGSALTCTHPLCGASMARAGLMMGEDCSAQGTFISLGCFSFPPPSPFPAASQSFSQSGFVQVPVEVLPVLSALFCDHFSRDGSVCSPSVPNQA